MSIRIVVQEMDGSFRNGEPQVFDSPTLAGAIGKVVQYVEAVIAPGDDESAANVLCQLLPLLGKISEDFHAGHEVTVRSDCDIMNGDGGVRVTMVTEFGMAECKDRNHSMVGKRVTNLKPDFCDGEDDEEIQIPVGSLGTIHSVNHEMPDGEAAFDIAWDNGGWTVYETSEFGEDIKLVESDGAEAL